MNSLAEYFDELLNIPSSLMPPESDRDNSDHPINCDKPAREGIKRAIKMMRTLREALPDDIPTESYLAELNASEEMLYPLCENIWEEEHIQED